MLDVGFCGLDTIIELGVDVNIQKGFKEMQSPIALCTPPDLELSNGNPISVATEYYNIANSFLAKKFKQYKIIKVRGASEAYPHLDGISAIVDIVESGKTIQKNNLELAEVITYTYPCLIQTKKNSNTYNNLSISDISKIIRRAINLNLSKRI